MIKFFTKSVPAVFMSAMMLMGPAAPARANTTSTLILIGAAAAILGTAINVSNKNRQANSVVGYLSNGDRVYADGHVVTSGGATYYPGAHGQPLQCQSNRCTIAGTNGMYNGRRVGYQNHHGANGRVLNNQQGPPNWAPANGRRGHHGPPR